MDDRIERMLAEVERTCEALEKKRTGSQRDLKVEAQDPINVEAVQHHAKASQQCTTALVHLAGLKDRLRAIAEGLKDA